MKSLIATAFLAASVSVFSAAPAYAQSTAPSAMPKMASPAPAASATVAPTVAPSATPTPTPPFLSLTGFSDFSYSTFSGANQPQFVGGGAARVFDQTNRSLDANALNFKAVKNGLIGATVELNIGTDANVIASYPIADPRGIDVTQAFVSGTLGTFTLSAGKFVTLAGAEVIRSPDNTNFSRSILFGYAIPFTHTGARLTYSANSALSLIAGVDRGWDNLRGNGGKGLTFEGGVAVNPNAYYGLTAQTYLGTERITNVPFSLASGQRALLDLVGTVHLTPTLTGVVNYDTASQKNAPIVDGFGTQFATGSANWNGIAGYLTLQATPKVSLSARGEQFNDASGYRTGFAQRWSEGTFTVGYAPSPSLLVRGELRTDGSNRSTFSTANGLGRGSLGSAALETIFRF